MPVPREWFGNFAEGHRLPFGAVIMEQLPRIKKIEFDGPA
jgi:hypothetical protein